MLSFPNQIKEVQYRLSHLETLKAQIKIMDTIGKRHYDIKKGVKFTTEKPYRSLADQLKDASYQRNEAYKNAYILFDKDTTRVDKFLQLIGTDMYPAFNAYAPVIIKELKPKYAYLQPEQVQGHLERLMLKQEKTKDVDLPMFYDNMTRQDASYHKEEEAIPYIHNFVASRDDLNYLMQLDYDIKMQIVEQFVNGSSYAENIYDYLAISEPELTDEAITKLIQTFLQRISINDIKDENVNNIEQILQTNNIMNTNISENASMPSTQSSFFGNNTQSDNSLSVNASTNSSIPSNASSTDIPTRNLFINQFNTSNTEESPIQMEGSDDNNIDPYNTIESIEQTPAKVDYDTLPDAPSPTAPYIDSFDGLPNVSDNVNPNTIDDTEDLDPIVLSTINNDYPNVSNLYMMPDNDISNIDLQLKKDIILEYHNNTETGFEYVQQRIPTHEQFVNLTNTDATEILKDLVNIVGIDDLDDNAKAAINNTFESKAVEEEKDDKPIQYVDFKDDDDPYPHYTTLQTTHMTTLTNALSSKSLKDIIEAIVSESLDGRLLKTTTFKTTAIYNKAVKRDLAKFVIDIIELPISDTIKQQIHDIISQDPKGLDHFTL